MEYNDIKSKARNSLYGLAIGDAINWNSVYHRSFRYPFWTRRLRREIDLDQDSNNIIKSSLPFSLNQQSEGFELTPTDDTEWVVFNMQNIIANNGKYDFKKVLESWKKLSEQKSEIKGSISVISALHNLRKGNIPPITGSDNPHYFDDSAMIRSIPITISNYSDLDKIKYFVSEDASITNSLEGLETAIIFSELLFHCLNGEEYEEYINSISDKIFNSRWIGALIKRSVDLSLKTESLFDLIPLLNNKVIDHSYNYGDGAPINLAIIFALLKYFDDNFNELILTANSITKAADSITPLLGALLGAKCSNNILSPQWKNSIEHLSGICIPSLKDLNYLELVETFIETSVD